MFLYGNVDFMRLRLPWCSSTGKVESTGAIGLRILRMELPPSPVPFRCRSVSAMCHRRCQERSRPSTTRMMKKLHHLRRRRRWANLANLWRDKSIQINRKITHQPKKTKHTIVICTRCNLETRITWNLQGCSACR